MAGSAVGCERYVPMQSGFGKGFAQSFFQFYDGRYSEEDSRKFECIIN
jgi:hypothetical protein